MQWINRLLQACLSISSTRRRSLPLAAALLTALVLFAPGLVKATTCIYIPPMMGPTDMPVTLSGNYTVGRDVAIGQPIATFQAADPLPIGVQVGSCDAAIVWGVVVLQTPHGPRESTYGTFPTNVPGIGVRLFNPAGDPNNAYPTGPQTATGTSTGVGLNHTHGYTLQFVKTAAVVGSGTVTSADIPVWQYNINAGAYVLYNYPISGTIQFQQGACQTPDVRVPLGRWPQTTFTGIGSSSGTRPVSISLNSCAAGMNSITYRIDPVTTVVNAAQSVVALDASSSATGVGVQLLDSTGTQPFPLQTWTTFTGYNAATGGSYTIPLKARYYQTAATVAPGLANTSMTFTMQYQ